MPLILASDAESLAGALPALLDATPPADALAIVLAQAESELLGLLRPTFPAIAAVDPASPRFARLNFDALALVAVDLAAEFLLSPAGRRLFDALGRLMEEGLTVAFVGDPITALGGALTDGVRAGLSLVPRTALIPALNRVEDLRGLLVHLSERQTRLLALDAPVALRYDSASDRVRVAGPGSVLLASFVDSGMNGSRTARLHVLTAGMVSGWPE